MAAPQSLGRWGEQAAVDYLVAQGWAITGRNVQCAGVEIDIIAQRGSRIAFVEVKTRATGTVDPLRQVTPAQRQRLLRAASAFVRSYGVREYPQVDIIAITGDEHDYRLEHFPDVAQPRLRSYR